MYIGHYEQMRAKALYQITGEAKYMPLTGLSQTEVRYWDSNSDRKLAPMTEDWMLLHEPKDNGGSRYHARFRNHDGQTPAKRG